MLTHLIRLIPPAHRNSLYTYSALSVLSVVLRAAGCLLLVPLLGALFSTTPAHALPWLAVLTAVTIGGWIVDTALARIGLLTPRVRARYEEVGIPLTDDPRILHAMEGGHRVAA